MSVPPRPTPGHRWHLWVPLCLLLVALVAALLWSPWRPQQEQADQAPPTLPLPTTQQDARPRAILAPQFVSTGTDAYWAARREADPTRRMLYRQLAATPSATWFDGSSRADDQRLADLLRQADRAHRVATIVLYGIPERDCGSLSRGGQPNPAAYRAWVQRVSRIVGRRDVVVVVEPDAISYCGSTRVRRVREPLLRFVGQTFHRDNPHAVLYLHVGDGTQAIGDVVQAVRHAGIDQMRGFALNVASHQPTGLLEAWGEDFRTAMERDGTPGLHYVIDTARNGLPAGPNPGAPFQACNNPSVAVGRRPTTHTRGEHADAYLWIKTAGGSDGTCHPGDPGAGKWFPAAARREVQRGLDHGTIRQLP